ncbi:uncharacterized protein UV8b_01339 [Ustilaginoidea virens]|uniref:tRNA (Uracil-5-)-methyltransferase n=2 Tax=Ustilaginoidea virens TaxID=1159556 RepID=A0A8E5HKU1_USTVR|nr:uncharacterized protein UV8b_01339 [Ustilaginoidea virens]QUC17098.1 hypothetical protein UV8b_01339 [Ustilaginoidea virens]
MAAVQPAASASSASASSASAPAGEPPIQTQTQTQMQIQMQIQIQQPQRAAKRAFRDSPGNSSLKKWKPKRTKRERNMTEGSSEEVLRRDIEDLLASRGVNLQSSDHGEQEQQEQQEQEQQQQQQQQHEPLPQQGTETEVDVVELSSTGDGLALRPGSDQVYVVPFTVPGDVARVKVHRHVLHEHHTVADFVAIVKPSPLRDDARVRCRYFSSCGGCQFQMLDYAEQLRLKKTVLEKAYRNFSSLAPGLVPPVGDTIGSPLEYGYRTKLTPHFDGPPGSRPARKNRPRGAFESCPDIGFMRKGQRKVLDIEDCPIGTSAVRLGMARERARMQREYQNYHRGATILLRENTRRYPKDQAAAAAAAAAAAIRAGEEAGPEAEAGQAESQQPPPTTDQPVPLTATATATATATTEVEAEDFVDVKSCETDSKATTTEYVGDHVFTNPAGSFFQNNNSILPRFTAYVRDRILPPPSSGTPIKYLIDAYSGSGLFTITLASAFQHSTGIDIAADSIASARSNASLNGLGDDRCSFIAADAGELFGSVAYPADETVVVLDPPRKGCDADFLAQLRRFAPRRILYVSCNVHTQARDVGVLVRGDGQGARYAIESLVGFDFFPQTGHVEGVAILNRCEAQSAGHSAAAKDCPANI